MCLELLVIRWSVWKGLNLGVYTHKSWMLCPLPSQINSIDGFKDRAWQRLSEKNQQIQGCSRPHRPHPDDTGRLSPPVRRRWMASGREFAAGRESSVWILAACTGRGSAATKPARRLRQPADVTLVLRGACGYPVKGEVGSVVRSWRDASKLCKPHCSHRSRWRAG